MLADQPFGSWLAIGVGGALVAAGAWLTWRHRRTWALRRQAGDDLGETDRLHYRGQYRRRMQVAAMLVILGVMIPVGDLLIPWRDRPRLFAFYWLGVLGIACWMLLLAVADLVSIRAHSRVELARVRRKQRELEAQIARIRSREGNGRRDP